MKLTQYQIDSLNEIGNSRLKGALEAIYLIFKSIRTIKEPEKDTRIYTDSNGELTLSTTMSPANESERPYVSITSRLTECAYYITNDKHILLAIDSGILIGIPETKPRD